MDGKKTWVAENNGHGEQTRLYYVKPTTTRGEQDNNAIIDLVDKFVAEEIALKTRKKDMKAVEKKLAKALFFRIKGQAKGRYYHCKTNTPNDPEIRKRILKDAKIEVIINDLPIDEAFNYFYNYA